jgi:hypothetical protein
MPISGWSLRRSLAAMAMGLLSHIKDGQKRQSDLQGAGERSGCEVRSLQQFFYSWPDLDLWQARFRAYRAK